MTKEQEIQVQAQGESTAMADVVSFLVNRYAPMAGRAALAEAKLAEALKLLEKKKKNG